MAKFCWYCLNLIDSFLKTSSNNVLSIMVWKSKAFYDFFTAMAVSKVKVVCSLDIILINWEIDHIFQLSILITHRNVAVHYAWVHSTSSKFSSTTFWTLDGIHRLTFKTLTYRCLLLFTVQVQEKFQMENSQSQFLFIIPPNQLTHDRLRLKPTNW